MSKQKVVISVPMENAKKRSKALEVVVGFSGVLSVGFDGADKGQIVVVGEGVDSVALTKRLRKKMGRHAQIVTVGPEEEKKKKEEKKEEKKKKEEKTPEGHRSAPVIIYQQIPDSCDTCTIM